MQKILFPMQYMKITQGINVGTHRGTYALDCAGSDAGIDFAVAPFTGIIKKKWANGNTVWLESTEPVLYADGSIDYATCSFTHDNNIANVSVGQIIKQGERFYEEGVAGQATGNHIHLEIGRGRFTGTGWYQNEFGIWTINNKYLPYSAFFVDGIIIVNGGGYNWKKEDTEVIIGTGDNWKWRFNRFHHQIVGNWDMGDDTWNAIKGKNTWTTLEKWSDHPNANQLLADQQLGELARKDGWQNQIYAGITKSATLEKERNLARDEAKAKQIALDAALIETANLKAELALKGDDTKNLNALGLALQWAVKRLGLK